MIPKIIHQTWHSDTLPVIFQKIKEANKKQNEDFEFKIWTNAAIEEFLAKEYKDILEIFQKTKFGVQKADIIRLVLLHHFGGVYIDMDILCMKPLKTLMDLDTNNAYLAMEPREQTKKLYNNENVICNAYIAGPAKHPLFKEALEQMRKIYKNHGDVIFQVFNVFGSDLLSKSMEVDENTYKACKFVNRKLVYPINDLKFDDLPTSQAEAEMLRDEKFDKEYMIHYWIHSNFESRDLLDKFDYDDSKSVHRNIYNFFKKLYSHNRYLQ